MQRLGKLAITMAVALWLLHSFVPHQHTSQQEEPAFSSTSSGPMASIWSLMVHVDLGAHHLEYGTLYANPSFQVPVWPFLAALSIQWLPEEGPVHAFHAPREPIYSHIHRSGWSRRGPPVA